MKSHYVTDLTDDQWEVLAGFMPPPANDGRPRKYPFRRIIDSILYLLREGCQWRGLPNDFPPYSSVYGYFRQWSKNGIWAQINSTLRKAVRVLCHHREENPTAGSIDSQSVKNALAVEERGYDAGKKIKGRKRHLLVDTCGLLIAAVVHSASIQDRDGGPLVLQTAVEQEGIILKKIWADQGYAGKFEQWASDMYKTSVEIVSRLKNTPGFHVLPRRWVVERTNSWISSKRRLRVDYERTITSAEGMIYVAMISKMLNDLAPNL